MSLVADGHGEYWIARALRIGQPNVYLHVKRGCKRLGITGTPYERRCAIRAYFGKPDPFEKARHRAAVAELFA